MKFLKYFKEELEKKPDFIMTISISGAGKSTWIKSINKNNDYVVVEPDAIRKEYGNVSDQSKNEIVWKLAKQRVIDALKNGKNAILDATNVNTKQRLDFIKNLPPSNLKAKIFNIDPEIAKQRIKKDLDMNIDRSAVPDFVIDRQYQNFLKTLKDIKNEPFEMI